jgi:hypothetical protein
MNRTNTTIAVTIVLGIAGAVFAEPTLQLYLQGGTYDAGTQSWVVTNVGDPLRLWVIADTSQGSVVDVKLSVAYAASETPTISLTGSNTGGYGGYTDPSAAANPTYLQTVTDGSSPVLWDGNSLGSHGIFGPETAWQEFALGDFTLSDSPIADFINSLPVPSDKMGQINVYDLTVSGASIVHFDVYDHVAGATHAVFSPFGHDGEGLGQGTVPAPAAALLALIGMGVTSLLRRHLR